MLFYLWIAGENHLYFFPENCIYFADLKRNENASHSVYEWTVSWLISCLLLTVHGIGGSCLYMFNVSHRQSWNFRCSLARSAMSGHELLELITNCEGHSLFHDCTEASVFQPCSGTCQLLTGGIVTACFCQEQERHVLPARKGKVRLPSAQS